MTVNVSDAAMNAFWAYWANTARTITRVRSCKPLINYLMPRTDGLQDWYLIIDLHGGPTSTVSAVPVDSTSYVHRAALLKYEFYDRVDSGTYPPDGFSFLDGWVNAIAGTMTPRGLECI